MMDLLCQLIAKEDGFRSEPFSCKREALLEIVKGFGEAANGSYLLILAEIYRSDDEGMDIRVSQCPLVSVSDLAEFLVQDTVSNIVKKVLVDAPMEVPHV